MEGFPEEGRLELSPERFGKLREDRQEWFWGGRMDKGRTVAWLGLRRKEEDGKHGFLSRKVKVQFCMLESLLAATWGMGQLKQPATEPSRGKVASPERGQGQGWRAGEEFRKHLQQRINKELGASPWVRVGRPREESEMTLHLSSVGGNRAGTVFSVWGDPRLEGAGLRIGSSLPLLPGVGTMLRLTPSLCPHPSKPTRSSLP